MFFSDERKHNTEKANAHWNWKIWLTIYNEATMKQKNVEKERGLRSHQVETMFPVRSPKLRNVESGPHIEG